MAPSAWGWRTEASHERTAAPGAVVITGASTGIGRATALHLDRLGHRVFAGIRQEADAASLRQSSSAKLSPVFLDVTATASIQAAVTAVAAEVGETGLTGVVNNAGIGLGGPLEFFPIDEFRRQLEINIVGPLAVTQAFLPLVRRASSGRLLAAVPARLPDPITPQSSLWKPWPMPCASNSDQRSSTSPSSSPVRSPHQYSPR
jgi:NAD(P)-dependent dehydrogenase (short-subunit alcohol dehydrogenase family)